MSDIECLFYTPKYMDEFISFVINGKRKPNGEPDTDGEGREITGVIKWLQGRGVPEAHFFNSAKGSAVEVFASTVQKPEVYDRPWMKEIPGFDVMVKTDGLIGKTTKFAPIADLLASLKSNAVLDQIFVKEKERVDKIRKEILAREGDFPFGEKEFLAALRGDAGSNSQAVFAEVKNTLKLSL